MGLDITAFSRLKHVGRHTEDYCEDENHVETYAYALFPRSFRGLPIIGNGRIDDADFIESGCMEITPETQIHGFRAGSYSGYNRWRSHLAAQFNPQQEGRDPEGFRTSSEPDPDKPFYELIWFADNEGSIGPEAAADLLADFREHRAAYRPLAEWDPIDDWVRAFELAVDGGLVRFH